LCKDRLARRREKQQDRKETHRKKVQEDEAKDGVKGEGEKKVCMRVAGMKSERGS
jgi:ribosome biogenesis protein BMS1